jgi:hypothetical protein
MANAKKNAMSAMSAHIMKMLRPLQKQQDSSSRPEAVQISAADQHVHLPPSSSARSDPAAVTNQQHHGSGSRCAGHLQPSSALMTAPIRDAVGVAPSSRIRQGSSSSSSSFGVVCPAS